MAEFYRQQLTSRGWTEEPSFHEEGEPFFTPRFDKDGFQLELTISEAEKKGQVRVSVQNNGNVDLRRLPLLPDAAEGGLGTFEHIYYETETPMATAAEFYRKELSKLGWKEAKGGRETNPDGSKTLEFYQNATHLEVDIDNEAVQIKSEFFGDYVSRPSKAESPECRRSR